jgi:hypothetical protein
MPGVRCTRSLACERLEAHELVTTGTPKHSGIPRAMVLTVSFALSPVTGLSCHCRQADHPAKLDASVGASGPHDFAVRVSVARLAILRVHRIPHPTFVTIAKRPSYWVRDLGVLGLILAPREAVYFSTRDWTTQINLKSLWKFAVLRGAISCAEAGCDQSGRAEKPN